MQSVENPVHELKELIARCWGIHSLRPLQEPAMQAVLEGRDSLVVLPTGGGKSLCYQAPAVFRGETTVVISPLISLMKDQVDGLRSIGVGATQLDSSQTAQERSSSLKDVREGNISLLFISPERLIQSDLCDFLRDINIRTFAIDEAHCISHWGHDFRPEYRQLRTLRQMFPNASLHAYTATATEQVRQDICDQLDLRSPEILVGNFDRTNLTYRVIQRRSDYLKQVLDVIERHRNEAGIIYCIRRADVEELSAKLAQQGIKAMPYHAGMGPQQRIRTQDAFIQEEVDVVVATVAFGMGIDRSDVRFVLHTAMPKSLEHYQQETGRGGRDGLEAECVLLHSGADFFTWKSIVEKASADQNVDAAFVQNALSHISDMDRYCRAAACRHKILVEYFGQEHCGFACNACDICLGETVAVSDATEVGQKILSCVARVKERYGVGHVVSVLRGENTENVRQRGHNELSTYGLLKKFNTNDVRDWIYQLVSQNVLVLEPCESSSGHVFNVLRLNKDSWDVMRGQRKVLLLQPAQRAKGEAMKKSRSDSESWDGVDRDLFEQLRILRREIADQRGVPPYIIFNDATLRELCRIRPSTLIRMRRISGIGDAKLADFGELFLRSIAAYCESNRLQMDVA